MAEQDVNTLTEAAARDELARLAEALAAANTAYHTQDAPEISDAEYDRLKQRNAAIETRFPELKREDSPSEKVGSETSDGFSIFTHAQSMLSLGNSFEDSYV